jgi:hypothetical protein
VSVGSLFGPLVGWSSRLGRQVILPPLTTAQPVAALLAMACRLMSGLRNRAGSSVVKPRLGLTQGDGLEARR